MKLYSLFLQHPIICTDSRNCPKGSLFFALKGDNFNANAFAFKALENGCSYAIVDDEKFALDERYIVVDNVLETLQHLARYHRNELKTNVVGITGTNGKTTTKELIASVLKQKFNVLFTQGNLNNHIGVPLTLLQLTHQHQIAVIEMGANHQGEIKVLSEIACPDYGIITNVGKAHLEGFGSFEGVKITKSELYKYIAESGKTIFINDDNDHLIQMAKNRGINLDKAIKYSLRTTNESCVVKGEILSNSPFLSLRCYIKTTTVDIQTKLVGAYNAENVLAAVTIGTYFGVEPNEIKFALENYTPQNNRSQFSETQYNKLIVDAYNANPTSMKVAIENFELMNSDGKVLILGDMFELGNESEMEHQQLVDFIRADAYDEVLLVGPCFAKTANNFKCFVDFSAIESYLKLNSIKNKIILIKGSRGVKLERVIDLL